MKKICNKCGILKSLKEFYKDKKTKDGLFYCCRECWKKYQKENKDKIAEYRKKYNEDNKEHFAEYYQNNKKQISEKHSEYYQNNKKQISEKHSEYKKNRRKTDPLFKKIENIRRNINKALRNRYNGTKGKYIKYLGCTGAEYAKYLETLWTPAMSWENYGCTKDKYWQIDHIIPVSSITCEEDMFKILHYTNTRPLSIEENVEKGSKNNQVTKNGR